MAAKATTLTETLYCERCGSEFEPKSRCCAGCHAIPTRQWLQLISLLMLLAAIAANSAAALFVLPRLEHARRAAVLFRAWLWVDLKLAAYGWAPLIAGLLAWDYFVWRRAKLRGRGAKVKRWVTKKVLTFVAAAAVTPLIPWWVPAGQPPSQFMSLIGRFPGLPATLAWGASAFALVLLCAHRPTRDSLLGHGKALSAASLGVLIAVLAATMVGWALTG
ncbi:MAG TPA: hypothetical protein VE996_01055 [Terriglobales bacterium]|nr:hypothetical protein [Terriglobales bacterium]